jgi:uncharacterized protein YfiM (DUF2279 family)
MVIAPPPPHAAPAHMRKRWWARKRASMPFAALIALILLLFDISPNVPAAAPLSGVQVKAAKRAFDRTRSIAGRDEAVPLSMSWEELSAATSLGGRAARVDRVSISPVEGAVELKASVPLAMVWINLEATVEPTAEQWASFPSFTARIGRLPMPRWTNRPLLWLAEKLLAWRGATIPPIRSIVSGLTISEQGVTARVKLPSSAHISAALQKLEADPLNSADVATYYCKLATVAASGAPLDVPTILRLTFADLKDPTPAQNRAALIAIAMVVDTRKLGDLAGDARARTEGCKRPAIGITLAGRADLAKHWAVSAALTAALGSDVSAAMGQWKEVSDSAPQGSGFSFVDLAADRSGVFYATRASAPETADETARLLANATPEMLLPRAALSFVEGLSEQAFRARFGNTDARAYQAATRQIDAILAQSQ